MRPFFLLYSALWRYKTRYCLYIASITLSVVSLGIIIPYYFNTLTNTLIAIQSEQQANVLQSIVLQIAAWSAVYVCARYSANWLITRALPHAIKDITDSAFKKIHSLSYHYHTNTFVGAQVAKIKRGADALLDLEFQTTRGIYEACIQLSVSIIVLYTVSPILSVLFIGFSAGIIAITLLLLRWKMAVDKNVSAYDSKTSSTLADSVANAIIVKAHGQEQFEQTQFERITAKKVQYQIASWDWSKTIEFSQGIILIVFQASILLVAIHLYKQSSISVGTIVLLQTYYGLVSRYLLHIAENLKNIQRHIASSAELFALLDETPEHNSGKRLLATKVPPTITFANVTFGYGQERAVLKNLHIRIQPYEKIGIVGNSGNGKSTIFNLLLRFFDVQAGEILFDSTNIQQLTLRSLRKHIAYVPQNPYLFHRTIAENIAYGKSSATVKEIIAAAKKAHAHEFIRILPHTYDTVVGERGVKLSGGERQRIALARAIVKDAPILLFDEATSALDSTSEKYIQQNMETIMSGKTALVIAHRISTIQKLDRIIVLDNGAICEEGTHAELLKRNGKYAELWQHQVDGFIAVE